MRRMRLILMGLCFALAFTASEARASLWVECMFAANVKDISLSEENDRLRTKLTLEVKIVTLRRGTNNSGGCGFAKGETIEITNYSDTPGERKTFVANSYDMKRIKPGDRVTIMYGLLDNDKGRQQIWEFLRVKSMGK